MAAYFGRPLRTAITFQRITNSKRHRVSCKADDWDEAASFRELYETEEDVREWWATWITGRKRSTKTGARRLPESLEGRPHNRLQPA